jgi:hypothetical protein
MPLPLESQTKNRKQETSKVQSAMRQHKKKKERGGCAFSYSALTAQSHVPRALSAAFILYTKARSQQPHCP